MSDLISYHTPAILQRGTAALQQVPCLLLEAAAILLLQPVSDVKTISVIRPYNIPSFSEMEKLFARSGSIKSIEKSTSCSFTVSNGTGLWCRCPALTCPKDKEKRLKNKSSPSSSSSSSGQGAFVYLRKSVLKQYIYYFIFLDKPRKK
jgi:hypothetical protein